MNAKALYRLVLIGLVVLLALPASTAQSQAEGPGTTPAMNQEGVSPMAYGPIPGGPGFVPIPPAAFNPSNDGTLYYNSGILATNAGSPHNIYVAAVSLPSGATITKMVVYFQDSDATQSLGMHFYRGYLYGNNVEELATVLSPVSPAGTQDTTYLEDTTVANPVVDNQTFSYYLIAVVPAATVGKYIMLRGVRIDYSYPVMLPTIQK